MTKLEVLTREMFAEVETKAARLLQLSHSTSHYWLEGDGQRGKAHRPIILNEPDRKPHCDVGQVRRGGTLSQPPRTHG